MLTDKIYSQAKQQGIGIIDELRGEKVIWPRDSQYASITVDLSAKGLDPHDDNGNAGVTILDMGKLLLQCSRDGDLEKVHELIARGAPFTNDWLGMSPLHFAAMNNKYEVCETLLRGGVNKDGKTKVDRTPLHLAAYEGHEDIVKLLLSKNCDINSVDMLRMTALHWAIEKGHKRIVRLLIKHGANVTLASKFNMTAISLAIRTKQLDLLEELKIEKEKQEKAAELKKFESSQFESETNQAVKSISGPENYDISSINEEELSIREKPNNNKNEDNFVGKEGEDLFTNKADTCTSSDDFIDEDMDYVEPIIQLESIDDDPKKFNTSTLELLKCHGISMLPEDDTENNLITSALESGRKFVLSEAGRRILNDTKIKQQMSEEVSIKLNQSKVIKNSEIERTTTTATTRKTPPLLRPKGMPLKQTKNIKIISMDTFKKMYGPEMANKVRRTQATSISHQDGNLMPTITKITKVQKSLPVNGNKITGTASTAAVTKSQPATKTIGVQKLNARRQIDEDLPPNIEVCTDSEPEEDCSISSVIASTRTATPTISTITTTMIPPTTITTTKIINSKYSSMRRTTTSSNYPVNLNINLSTNNNNNSNNSRILSTKPLAENCSKVPVLSLPEVTRQLYVLRRQIEDLQKQLEYVRKENVEYRERIERLERDRENFIPMDDIL